MQASFQPGLISAWAWEPVHPSSLGKCCPFQKRIFRRKCTRKSRWTPVRA